MQNQDSVIYYKFLNIQKKQYGVQYKIGEIVDPLPFNNNRECGPGGIYFCKKEHLLQWIYFGPYLATLTVPKDVEIVDLGNKLKAHVIFIHSITLWYENEEIVKYFIQKDASLLSILPKSMVTYDLCLCAADPNGKEIGKLFLENVPEEFKTFELCKLALQQYPHNLIHVPKHILNEELCNVAMAKSRFIYDRIPESCRTYEFYLTNVKRYGNFFTNVPIKFQTLEMCMAAVQNDGWMLKYVPEEHKTLEICLLAREQNQYSEEFVPLAIKNKLLETKEHKIIN